MTQGNGGSDPSELFSTGIKFLGEAVKLFGRQNADEVRGEWAQAADKLQQAFTRPKGGGGSAASQREDLLIGLGHRAVTALEDVALNVAAIRQRLNSTAAPQEPEGGIGD